MRTLNPAVSLRRRVSRLDRSPWLPCGRGGVREHVLRQSDDCGRVANGMTDLLDLSHGLQGPLRFFMMVVSLGDAPSRMESVKQFLQTKSVWISTADDVPNPFVMR